MDTMRAEAGEFECCPQCAGWVAEAMDAAGMSGDCGVPAADACDGDQPTSQSSGPRGWWARAMP